VKGLGDVMAAAAAQPTLVLCGQAERRILQRAPGLSARTLAVGPKGNALLEVR